MFKRNKLSTCILVVCLSLMFGLLQGCSYKEIVTPITTHNITINETNAMAFKVELKANTEEGYTWYQYATYDIDCKDTSYSKGILNNTYSSDYSYLVREKVDFDYYLILVKDNEIDQAIIFPYEFKTKDDSLVINEMSKFELSTNPALSKIIKKAVTIEE